MAVSSQNLYADVLTPSVRIFGGGAFGRCLGHEGGALMTGIIKETPESSFAPLPCGDTAKRRLSLNQEGGTHQTLNLLVTRCRTS